MKRQFGKATHTPPLPAAPPGLKDPLIIAPPERRPRTATATQPRAAAHEARPPPQAAQAAIDASPQQPPPAPPQHPTSPTTLTRQALYDAVWQTPMSRLTPTYGISGNGLAKICDRFGVPYPPRGLLGEGGVGGEASAAGAAPYSQSGLRPHHHTPDARPRGPARTAN